MGGNPPNSHKLPNSSVHVSAAMLISSSPKDQRLARPVDSEMRVMRRSKKGASAIAKLSRSGLAKFCVAGAEGLQALASSHCQSQHFYCAEHFCFAARATHAGQVERFNARCFLACSHQECVVVGGKTVHAGVLVMDVTRAHCRQLTCTAQSPA